MPQKHSPTLKQPTSESLCKRTLGTETTTARRNGYVPYPVGPPSPLPGDNPLINDPDLLHDLCLDWNDEDTCHYLGSIPTYSMTASKRNICDPPEDIWVVESESIKEHLLRRLAGRKADRRTLVKPVRLVERSHWTLIIDPQQSAIIRDTASGKIVCVVIRDFVPKKSVVTTVDAIAAKHLSTHRNVRMDDRGTMALYGYSGGAISQRHFAYSRNCIDMSVKPAELQLHNHDLVSAHTLLWNIMNKKVPAEVIEKIKSSMKGLPSLDWNMMGEPTPSRISLKVDGQYHELTGLPLGPCSGVCAEHYSRACHLEAKEETSPWVCSLTTKYEGNAKEDGGCFYLAGLKVLIEPATNTFIAHKNNMLHGTTVHDIDWVTEEAELALWRKNVALAKEAQSLTLPEPPKPHRIQHRGMSMLIADGMRRVYDKSFPVKRKWTPEDADGQEEMTRKKARAGTDDVHEPPAL